MIKQYDLLLSKEEPSHIGGDIEIRVLDQTGSRPVSILIRGSKKELKLVRFAGLSYFKQVGALTPFCEVIEWGSIKIIFGLLSLVVIKHGEPYEIALFREAVDDYGFYKVDWIENEKAIFCIYESGILAIDVSGEVLWHIKKYWDDLFDGIESGNLVLLAGDDRRILIDVETGARELAPPV